MDRKTEERLFELFKHAYNSRKEVVLTSEWRKSLMQRVLELSEKSFEYSNLNSGMFGIPYPLRVSITVAFVLALLVFVVSQYQFSFDMMSLAFEVEQDINIAI